MRPPTTTRPSARSTSVSYRVTRPACAGLSTRWIPRFGVEKARVVLVRRGGDPNDAKRGPINGIVPDPIKIPSHHGPDVQTVLPKINIDTAAMKVPTTLMHMHFVNMTLKKKPFEGRRDLRAEAVPQALAHTVLVQHQVHRRRHRVRPGTGKVQERHHGKRHLGRVGDHRHRRASSTCSRPSTRSPTSCPRTSTASGR